MCIVLNQYNCRGWRVKAFCVLSFSFVTFWSKATNENEGGVKPPSHGYQQAKCLLFLLRGYGLIRTAKSICTAAAEGTVVHDAQLTAPVVPTAGLVTVGAPVGVPIAVVQVAAAAL